jgi:hypothetical protein
VPASSRLAHAEHGAGMSARTFARITMMAI